VTPETPDPFATVGIVGFGLMGGALARDLKALPTPPTIRAISLDDRDLEAGLGEGVLDEAPDTMGEFLEGLDLVVYATPLSAIQGLLEAHRKGLGAGTIVTDMISLKAPVLDLMRTAGLAERYVGSHPGAGGGGRGFSASRTGIFLGRRIWLVEGDAPPEMVVRVARFWESVGGSPAPVSAVEHDVMMAWVSHLPQLASNALALALERGGFARASLGTGGVDMTRLALSSPDMWADLIASSPMELREAMDTLISVLQELASHLEQGDVEEIMSRMEQTNLWALGESWN